MDKGKSLRSEKVIEDLKDYILNPRGIVLLFGTNGTGKTYAAMHVYQQLTPYKLPERDHDLAWFITQADLNMLFSETHEKWGHATTLLKQCCKSKLFVIDDFGTRIPSDAFMDFLYALIDFRWTNSDKLGTIITTNMNSTRMRKEFGDPIFSRIASGRRYIVTGEDRRFTQRGIE